MVDYVMDKGKVVKYLYNQQKNKDIQLSMMLKQAKEAYSDILLGFFVLSERYKNNWWLIFLLIVAAVIFYIPCFSLLQWHQVHPTTNHIKCRKPEESWVLYFHFGNAAALWCLWESHVDGSLSLFINYFIVYFHTQLKPTLFCSQVILPGWGDLMLAESPSSVFIVCFICFVLFHFVSSNLIQFSFVSFCFS